MNAMQGVTTHHFKGKERIIMTNNIAHKYIPQLIFNSLTAFGCLFRQYLYSGQVTDANHNLICISFSHM